MLDLVDSLGLSHDQYLYAAIACVLLAIMLGYGYMAYCRTAGRNKRH